MVIERAPRDPSPPHDLFGAGLGIAMLGEQAAGSAQERGAGLSRILGLAGLTFIQVASYILFVRRLNQRPD